MLAGSDGLAGGCSPRVERGGQEALADILDHPGSRDAEKLMETVVKASALHCNVALDVLDACQCFLSNARLPTTSGRCLSGTQFACSAYDCTVEMSAHGQSMVRPGSTWARSKLSAADTTLSVCQCTGILYALRAQLLAPVAAKAAVQQHKQRLCDLR